ncbi:putative uncharacterized protein DDB_G0283431 [Protopterus annectens]|uniref:putative uncharacterized protein DDB_G0283431 n=1 Tax=Protopterus annectens TaxID=7888 RepID=UPI001CFABF2C|nr:putative uncharacterized protein DDB_G0283431 [Protopterus annectens]
MDKMHATKKRKITRDLYDYLNNIAYPKPPSNSSPDKNDIHNNNRVDGTHDQGQARSFNNISNNEGNGLRRSERIINRNNNTNDTNANDNYHDRPHVVNPNNEQNNSDQGFRTDRSCQQNNRRTNRNQRNRRKQRR